MLIALCIIAYILIGCVVGVLFDYYDDEVPCEIPCEVAGIFWPIVCAFTIIWVICSKFCEMITSIVRYLDTEGFHYCKEDIPSCCGKCKYMYYWNDHNELNGCRLKKHHSQISSEVLPCSRFKKHWLWRFRIRYKWDEKTENK